MKYKDLIKNNLKFIIAMSVVIAFGIIGITFAISIDTFNPIGINVSTATLGANITYLNGSSAAITNTGNLLPINDVKTEITPSTTDSRILKIDFKLSGVSTNPDNTIMDISLNSVDISCPLRNEYFKWKLYKDGTLISTGNFSPKFDIIENNRIVLTSTQESLTITGNTYSLIFYIAESCTGDLSTCNANNEQYNQSGVLAKHFSAIMKVELSTGSKKTNTRKTSNNYSCYVEQIAVPTCNSNLTYNGGAQELITDENGNIRFTNNSGTDAGSYTVIVRPKSSLMSWKDGTTNSKPIICTIAKKEVTITPSAQTITQDGNVVSDPTKLTVTGLVSGHSISHIHLYTDRYATGTGTIYASAAQVVDSSGNDVTDNYSFTYNTGTVTIK